jgi:hypothetical protein
MHLTMKKAAKLFGISLNHMKRCVRRLGLKRWHARRIKCLIRLRDTMCVEEDERVRAGGSVPCVEPLAKDREDWETIHPTCLNLA